MLLVTATLDSARVYAWEDSYANRLDVWASADPGLVTITQAGQVLDLDDPGTNVGGSVYRYWLNEAPGPDAPITIASATDTICWGYDGAPCLPDFAMVDSTWLTISSIGIFSNMLANASTQQVSPSTGIKVAMDSGYLFVWRPVTPSGGWATNYQDLLWQTKLWRERWNQ